MSVNDPSEIYPIASFHFEVDFGGYGISFQEVSGLDQQIDTLEYRHGNNPSFMTMKRAGIQKANNIVFKRGIVVPYDDLIWEYNLLYEKDYYSFGDWNQDLLIKLLDESGEPVMYWKVLKAIPVKVSGPTLKADSSEIAIESIELTHEGVIASLTEPKEDRY